MVHPIVCNVFYSSYKSFMNDHTLLIWIFPLNKILLFLYLTKVWLRNFLFNHVFVNLFDPHLCFLFKFTTLRSTIEQNTMFMHGNYQLFSKYSCVFKNFIYISYGNKFCTVVFHIKWSPENVLSLSW